MIRRFLGSLSALVVLVAVVVGAPIVLWRVGRPLFPDHMPPWSQVWDTLWSQDSGQLFLGLMVVVGTIAWAVFTLAVLLEIVSRAVAKVSGRRQAMRVRFLKWPRAAASTLISLLLTGGVLLGSAATASAQPINSLHASLATPYSSTAATSPHQQYRAGTVAAPGPGSVSSSAHHTRAPEAAAAGQPHAAVGQKTWVVGRYDTLSSIAEKTLGDWQLYPQITKLNVGITQPDGRTLHDANTPLQVGWRLLLPANAQVPAAPAAVPQHTVTVHQGETLSGIAAQQLGSADLYPTLAAANHLANPDDLDVGQVLTIPAQDETAPTPTTAHSPAAPGPERKTPAEHPRTATPAGSRPPASTTTPPAGHDVGQNAAPAVTPPHITPHAAAPAGGNVEVAPVTPETTSTLTPNPAPATAAAAPAADSRAESSSSASPAVNLGIGAAALAGTVWLGLLAARRRKGRRRPSGEIPAPVSLQSARMERRLRERASAVDVTWMDQALRCAATLSAGRTGQELPDVTCVWLGPEELQLQLAVPVEAPAPFVLEDDSWILPVEADLPTEGMWTDPAAPFPTLASLGELEGESFLVDLERLGAITLTGDPDRTAALLRHLAVDYAHNLWSDHLQVTLVGWGEDMVVLNPDRVRYAPSAGDVVAALRGRLQESAQVQAELGATVLASRITDHSDDDPWVPEILLVDNSASTEDLNHLTQALDGVVGTGRAAVAVVVRSDNFAPPAGAVISIDAAGMLSLPTVLGPTQQVVAAGLSEEDLVRLLDLFTKAGEFEKPSLVGDTEPWAQQMDITGALVTDLPAGDAGSEETAADEPSGIAGDVGQNVLPLRSGASEAAYAALAAALAADPDLDRDLAEWHFFPAAGRELWDIELAARTDPVKAKELKARGGVKPKDWVRRPRIGVLGDPIVLARGQLPSERRSRFTEMCVYLAMHKEVDAQKFSDDLWADDAQPTGETRRSDVSRCRSWLGVDEEGRKYLPDARNKPYRLTRLLDLDLFRRLRKRADAKLGVSDVNGAIEDLAAAIALVRGPVLTEAPRDAYAWLATSDPAELRTATLAVISATRQLVDLALEQGDLDLARAAADVGHTVDHNDDQPLVDLMRISHRAGDDAAARGWVRSILEANEVESIEDIVNHATFMAVNQVFPHGLRAPAG